MNTPTQSTSPPTCHICGGGLDDHASTCPHYPAALEPKQTAVRSSALEAAGAPWCERCHSYHYENIPHVGVENPFKAFETKHPAICHHSFDSLATNDDSEVICLLTQVMARFPLANQQAIAAWFGEVYGQATATPASDGG